MKKFLVLCLVCFCLIFSQTTTSLSEFSKNFLGTHTFFSSEKFENEKTTTVANGNGFLISCATQDASEVFLQLEKSKIAGECFCFYEINFDFKKLLKKLNAKIVKTEITQNIYIIYAYSNKFLNFVFVEGKKVNLQIANNNNFVTVGTPLVLGSFWNFFWKNLIFSLKNTKILDFFD